jgi:hypothetical protein
VVATIERIDVALLVCRVELGEEAAARRHHVEDVADLQHVEGVLGERPARQPLDRDPQHAGGHRRADRVVAPHAVAGQLGAHGQVLALGEGVVLAQVLGHREGERDRVVGQRLDGADPERVENRVGGGHSGPPPRRERSERLGAVSIRWP